MRINFPRAPSHGLTLSLMPATPALVFAFALACTLSGAPGEYAVMAFRGEDRPNFYDEKEAARLAAAAPRVTLVAGKPGTFELSLPAGH